MVKGVGERKQEGGERKEGWRGERGRGGRGEPKRKGEKGRKKEGEEQEAWRSREAASTPLTTLPRGP